MVASPKSAVMPQKYIPSLVAQTARMALVCFRAISLKKNPEESAIGFVKTKNTKTQP